MGILSKLAKGTIGVFCLFNFQSSVADTPHEKSYKEKVEGFFQARDELQRIESHPLEPLYEASQGDFYHHYLTRIDRYVSLSPDQIEAMDLAKDSYWQQWWQSLEKELNIGHIAANENDLYSLMKHQGKWMMMSHNDQIFIQLDSEIEQPETQVEVSKLPISSSDIFYALLSKKNKAKGS